MKIRWVNICRWMLGVLGISATISSCDWGGFMRVEYGQPNMDYSVKGKVVDSVTGEGVSGIEVMQEPYQSQSDTTAADGSFEIAGNTFPSPELIVGLRDIDSEKDGFYADTTHAIHLTQVENGSGSWYEGYYEAGDVVLKMKKVEKE